MKYELTGVSTPVGGVSWKKIATGKEMFTRLFLYLESKRAVGYHLEDEAKREWVVRSVLEIRNTIISMTEGIDLKKFDLDILKALLRYCNSFLDEVDSTKSGMIIYDKNMNPVKCSYHEARSKLIEGFFCEIEKVEKKYNLTYEQIAQDYHISFIRRCLAKKADQTVGSD